MESPPTSAQLVISSSPSLPDLEDILSKAPKRPPLRSGNRASARPATARTTFTSAADLLREAPEIDIETEEITKSPARNSKPIRRRGTKAPQAASHERPFLGRAGSLGSLSPDEKPWQLYKSKQSPNDGSPSPSRSSPSAQPVAATTSRNKIKVGSKVVSRHFATKAESPPIDLTSAEPKSPVQPVSPVAEPSVLSRRRDWTPPPADTVILLDSESDNKEMPSSAANGANEEQSGNTAFQSLQDQYGCKTETSDLTRVNKVRVEVLGKRKLIETVAVTGQRTSRSVSPTKPAATKRKVRTITELALAPYAAPIEPEFDITIGHTRDSLLGYLDQGGDVKALFEVQEAALAKAKDGKKPAKAPPKKPRKKNGKTVEVPILLSPSTALKQSSKQDFVFGTSSQLVTNDSPRALRELQLAIQASNKLDEEDDADDQAGLWHAGARDVDGSLLEFRYVHSTPPAPASAPPSPSPQPRIVSKLEPDHEPPAESGPPANQPAKEQNDGPGSAPAQLEQEPEKSLVPTPKSKTPRKPKKPNYDLLTDVQLARKIKTFGFKPIKRRSAMVALLDQCWESQHQDPSPPGLEAVTASTVPKPVTTATPSKAAKVTKRAKADDAPKKPRGRSKKVVAGAVDTSEVKPLEETKARSKSPAKTRAPRAKKGAVVAPALPIEIPDSDDILDEQLSTPSTPAQARSSPEPVFSPPNATNLDLSIGDEADMSLALSPTNNEEALFKHITDVVKATPRSTDPAAPSWHEQMLLYDPIVLEDFTAWLNSGELTKVGYDAEVAPTVVKKWCESKSVVCLWKQTTRGKERKRY